VDGSTVFALTCILVPTNLGEPSRAAIQYGLAFARQFGAKLFLLHVLDAKGLDAALETERVLEVLSPETPAPVPAEPSPLELARNAARHDLGRLLSLDDERATHAEYLLRASGMAGVGDAISKCAREVGAELIVMGKHHLGVVEHLIAGSVAEKVIRHAPCPVLIVQHPMGAGASAGSRHFVLSDAFRKMHAS
jgi:nucleotide-binding universal stress UspA family protein